jgi:thiol-disulfide isomerase/thioredoxin
MKDVRGILDLPNVIIFFHMEGCPYCIKTRPFWNQLKKAKLNNKYKFYEIESADVSPQLREQKNISGYPHFIVRTDGQEIGSSGSKNSLQELIEGLHLKRGGRLSRRNTRRLRRTIRKSH